RSMSCRKVTRPTARADRWIWPALEPLSMRTQCNISAATLQHSVSRTASSASAKCALQPLHGLQMIVQNGVQEITKRVHDSRAMTWVWGVLNAQAGLMPRKAGLTPLSLRLRTDGTPLAVVLIALSGERASRANLRRRVAKPLNGE